MKAILLIVLAALLLPAQTVKRAKKTAVAPPPAPAVNTFPLREIQIKGNKLLTQEQVREVLALPLGKEASKEDLEAARDRLLATGYFETVAFQYGPSGTGSFAVFEVAEVPSVYPVVFENLPVASKLIERELKSKNIFWGDKVPGTQQVIGMYARQIEQILALHNHPDRVLGELTPEGQGFHILFRSAEPLPPIAFVTFTGNKAITTITLQNAMNDVAFGVPFSRDHFRELLDHQIRPLYDAKGLVRVSFPMFTTDPAPKVKGVTVHVTIEEGPAYKLGKVKLTGVDSDYQDDVKLKPGEPANFDEVNETLSSLKSKLKRNGYLDADGSVERKVDDKALTVAVTINMIPGPLYTMGTLTIKGLDLNSEPVVRKMWSTEAGKPFNALYPDYFLKRIREGGIFDGLGTTKSATTIDDKTHVVDVTLTFGSSPKPSQQRKRGPGGPAGSSGDALPGI